MDWIFLRGISAKAPVGVTEMERREKSHLSFDIGVKSPTKKAGESDELGDSIDYSILYNIVMDSIKEPCKLLETVAWRIRHRTFEALPQVNKIKLIVRKINPPIGKDVHSAEIQLKFKR